MKHLVKPSKSLPDIKQSHTSVHPPKKTKRSLKRQSITLTSLRPQCLKSLAVAVICTTQHLHLLCKTAAAPHGRDSKKLKSYKREEGSSDWAAAAVSSAHTDISSALSETEEVEVDTTPEVSLDDISTPMIPLTLATFWFFSPGKPYMDTLWLFGAICLLPAHPELSVFQLLLLVFII